MAKCHHHPHHEIRFYEDLRQDQPTKNPPDEKDRSGRGFLVFGRNGNVVNARQRRSHAARVGHRRATNTFPSKTNPSIYGGPHPTCTSHAPYQTLLTTFRTRSSSKKYTNKSMAPPDGPLPVERDRNGIKADDERLVLTDSKHQQSLTHLLLNVFPLEIQGRAKDAYTYYTEIYIPTAFRKGQYRGIRLDLSIRDQLPFFLSDKLIFAAVLARAILQRDLLGGKLRTPSVEATQAYGLALGLLRQYLVSSTDKVSDMFICALVFLIAFDNVLNNSSRVRIHATALKEAIASRGGLEKLGDNGKAASATASLILNNTSQQAPIMRSGNFVQRSYDLKPPDHPFSPRICSQIATLTPAFQELCLHEHLVEPVIELLAQISGWRGDLHTGNDTQKRASHFPSPSVLDTNQENAIACAMLLQNPNLPISDQLIVMALCTLMDYAGQGSLPHQAFLQSHAAHISPNLLAVLACQTRNAEWLTWVALVLLASSQVGSATWSMGMRILDEQEPEQSWEERLVVCGKYFWNADFSLILLQKLHSQRG